MLDQRRILLGVTGSIAAYKAVALLRLLSEAGADVWPVLTRAATRFVGPMTFSVLSGHRAIVDLWSASEAGEVGHVELAHRVDAIVIAPATADTLARLAGGRADDPLTAVTLASGAPLLVAPAMETGMWNNAATQRNLDTLRADRNALVVPPEIGSLASGRRGVGRMADPEAIIEQLHRLLGPLDLAGHRLVISAGPTRESFDPARFISNPSTGKMGLALARVALRRGAEVTLVLGPTSEVPPAGATVCRVETTEQMLAACREALPGAAVVIMAAAPADFRPAVRADRKLKKGSQTSRTVELIATADILSSLGAEPGHRIMVGFAAETDDLIANARLKLAAKGLDLIVANDVSRADAGFGVDTNAVTLLFKDGRQKPLDTRPKEHIASCILDEVAQLLEND